VASAWPAWIVSHDTIPSSMDVSTNRPRPVVARSTSAERIPMTPSIPPPPRSPTWTPGTSRRSSGTDVKPDCWISACVIT